MALINCPECNKEISDKALVCPNCGENSKKQKLTLKRWIIIAIGVAILLAIWGIYDGLRL